LRGGVNGEWTGLWECNVDRQAGIFREGQRGSL
jgi:hypothetical protein